MSDEELWGEGWRQGHADALSNLKRDEKQALADRQEIERLRGLLLDGKLIAQRTISESLGCGDHQEMMDEWINRIDAALAGAAVQPEGCCLDYPRCDCNSPPEPDDDWLCFQRPAQPKVTP